MSDDDPDEEPVEEPDQDAGADADQDASEDDRPEIEADERADVGDLRDKISEVSDEVAEDNGLESSSDDADDEDDADAGEDTDAPETTESAPDTGESGEDSMGDMYAGVVAMLAIAMAEELGDGETDQDADDIAAMLRGGRGSPINVAANVDRLLEESGRGADLPPGKAVVIGTVVAVGMVLLQETDLANSLVSELLSGEV